MTIKIHFDSDLKSLAGTLEKSLASEAIDRPVFQPHNVVVPNNHLKTWLPITLSSLSEHKVSANVTIHYLENALWSLLQAMAPDQLTGSKLNREATSVRILKHLLDMDPGKPGELSLIRDYLYIKTSGPDSGPAGRDGMAGLGNLERVPDFELRLFNLSSQLAGLFMDYEFHRFTMVEKWKQGKLSGHQSRDMEVCQMYLYNSIFDQKGKDFTLPQFAGKVFSNPQPRGQDSWHFFGFSELSEFHLYMLWRLGQHFDINLYQYNVCEEYWEDVTSTGEDKSRFLKAFGANAQKSSNTAGEFLKYKDETRDNPLLKAWGKPGRELLKGFSDKEQQHLSVTQTQSFITPGVAGEPQTALAQLQQQVRMRLIPDDGTGLTQDTSLQIASCPDIVREVETVLNSILTNMARDKTLKTTDISILVADMGKYKPVIQSLFTGSSHVPFNLSDSSADSDSLYSGAVQQLLDISTGSFTRNEMFGLFYNPCFMAAAGLDQTRVNTWLHWAENLNIFRWANGQHKKEEAPEFTHDLYSWQWGLKRLRLGRIMDEGPSGTFPPAYADSDSRNTDVMSGFSGTVESLIGYLRRLTSKESRSPAEWLEQFTELLDRFLEIPDERSEEATARAKLLQSLQNFSEYAGAAELELNFELFKQAVTSGLSDISSRLGTYSMGGVTVASLNNARPIPFKIVYVLGMQEGSFPSEPTKTTLDLRMQSRLIGDMDPRDHSLYRFLEVFMSVKEKLYLMYVGRDLQKDEMIQPCSVIKQIISCANDSMNSDPETETDPDDDKDRVTSSVSVSEKGRFNIVTIPLHGFSRSMLAAQPDYTDLLVNYSASDKETLQAQLNPDGSVPDTRVAKVQVKESAPGNDGLEDATGIRHPASGISGNQQSIDIRHLRNFLVNPIEGMIKYHLGLYDDEGDEAAEAIDEPFSIAYPADSNIVSGSLAQLLQDHLGGLNPEPSRIFEEQFDLEHRRGSTPDSVFAKKDRDELLKVVRSNWQRFLECGVGEGLIYHNTLNVGGGENAQGIILDCGGTRVQLTGLLNNVWTHESGSAMEALHFKGRYQPKTKEAVLPFLFYTALSSQAGEPGELVVTSIGKGEAARWGYQWPEARKAREYLELLVSGFLNTDHFDWLPWEVIDKSYQKEDKFEPQEGAFAADLLAKIQAEIDSKYSNFPYFKLLHLKDVTVPADARDVVLNRYRPFRNFTKLDEAAS